MGTGIFNPLKIRSFRSLFGAQIFSDLGSWLDLIALQVIVAYHWGLDETAIAAVIITIGLPWVIIGPFASVFVDRWSKKKIMMICLMLRIAFVMGLFMAPNLYYLLLFVFLKGTAAAVYDPARQSMIRLTVPENKLPEAVTLSQLSVNTMKIVGPALGGGMIALFGVKSPFLFEACGFLIAIIFLAYMPKLEDEDHTMSSLSEHKPQMRKSYWADLSEGIRHIAKTPLLKVSIILSSVAFFIIFLYDGLFVFIAQLLGFNEGNFGLLISGVGFGSVMGSLMLGKWTKWKDKPVHFMSGASVLSGSLIILVGLGCMGIIKPPLIVWIIGAFLLGLLGSGEAVPYGYVLQSQTPKRLMGRVSSAAMSLQTFSMLIAPAAGALLAKLIGVPIVFICAGFATCLLGSFVLLFVIRKLKMPIANVETKQMQKTTG